MTFRAMLLISAFVCPGAALAAEPDARSPYDTNPSCTERTADGASPECTLQTEGTPRHVYPPRPRRPVVTPPPQTPSPPPPPPPRMSNRDSGKAGGGAAK